MKLFFISDIHGSIDDLNWAIKKFQESSSDYLIILGDQLYHGPRNPLPDSYNPAEVSKVLNKYKDKIIAVRGNCDSEVDQMLLEYPTMADYTILIVDNLRFFLSHGHIYNKDNKPPITANTILCHGHTHLPVAEKIEDFYLFNPGSITFPKGEYKKSYGLYENYVLKVVDLEGKIIKEIKIK